MNYVEFLVIKHSSHILNKDNKSIIRV